MDPETATGLLIVAAFIVVLLVGLNKGSLEKEEPPVVHVEMSGPAKLPPLAVAEDERRAFYKQVHGILHKNDDGSSRQRIIHSCRVGEPIELVPEPDNAYDHDAVKVCRANGEQLGYLPSGHRMAENGDLNADYRVTIEEIYPLEEKPGKMGCKLRIGVLKT
jgi:hypothetical protein